MNNLLAAKAAIKVPKKGPRHQQRCLEPLKSNKWVGGARRKGYACVRFPHIYIEERGRVVGGGFGKTGKSRSALGDGAGPGRRGRVSAQCTLSKTYTQGPHSCTAKE